MAKTRWIAAVLAVALGAGLAEGLSPRTDIGPDGQALVRANDRFAFDLYAELRAREGNVFYSPYSISTALAMTYAGARGQTATEMVRALRFPMSGDRLHQAFGRVMGDVSRVPASGKVELHVANALWPQAGLPVDADFRKIVESQYRAGLTPLDFRATPERARGTINGWVEQQTRDRIKDLIPEGAIDARTRLVLANAIYFKGAWAQPFPAGVTRGEAFTLSTGQKIASVPLMHRTATFRYLDAGSFQAIELPYDGGALSMVVLLPKRAGDLAALEQTLTAARVSDALAQMTRHEVELALPRFKVTAEFRLREPLGRLGMPRAFSDAADFSGMAQGDGLKLSDVFHKAYVEVLDEVS
jgi:serpin B